MCSGMLSVGWFSHHSPLPSLHWQTILPLVPRTPRTELGTMFVSLFDELSMLTRMQDHMSEMYTFEYYAYFPFKRSLIE